MIPRLLIGGCFLVCLTGWAFAGNSFSVSSPAFATGHAIPVKHALHQQNVSPELRVVNVPANARSLVLIVDDPDAPAGTWVHWLVWNLPPATTVIPEGGLPPGACVGKNSFGRVRYDGPAPPEGTHRYFFRLYALDTLLDLPEETFRPVLLAAMKGHVVGQAETFGIYRAAQN